MSCEGRLPPPSPSARRICQVRSPAAGSGVGDKINKNDGVNFIAVRQIVFEILEKNTFPLLDFGAASPLNAWSEQKTKGTIGKLVKN